MCKWLVADIGVDVNAGTDNGTVPLHFAIWMGHVELVKWLVEFAQCDVNQRNIHGCNAAHWCAFNGDVDMMIYLFSKGLVFFHINDNRRSPLHKAAVKSNVEACKWLLDSCGLGYGHMQPDIEGDTPCSLAKSCGNFELMTFLADRYEDLRKNHLEIATKCSP